MRGACARAGARPHVACGRPAGQPHGTNYLVGLHNPILMLLVIVIAIVIVVVIVIVIVIVIVNYIHHYFIINSNP